MRTGQDLRLQWRLGQIPKLWKNIPTPRAQVDLAKRQWQMGRSNEEGFPAIVRAMIPKHIPALYLEGYGDLRTCCAGLPWPGKPSLIFASNLFVRHDVFKAWVAQKTEDGAPLVTGQHGGLYSLGLWYFIDEHQRAISDAFITWGWNAEGEPKIKPVGNLKMAGRDLGWDPKGDALMIQMARPRYSYHMFSMPFASQWLDYFEDQCRFVTALPECLRERLVVRLYGSDYGWCQKLRWQDRFADIRLDEGSVPIESLVENSRLAISTYNGTTFLESMAANVPTIIFWNPNHWEISKSGAPYMEQLKIAGVFHETPESAAQQMAQVWDDVAGWWNSGRVQSARKEFCHRYSRLPEDFLGSMEHILRQMARKPGVAAL
jgi:putative transferase (TIGR04331 family)